MPTYEYACTACSHAMEAFQRMSDALLQTCPACGEPALKRKIGRGAGIIFKGAGFYETDFKDRKGTKDSDKPADTKTAAEAAAPASAAPAPAAKAEPAGAAAKETPAASS